jgi:hypothetical protein
MRRTENRKEPFMFEEIKITGLSHTALRKESRMKNVSIKTAAATAIFGVLVSCSGASNQASLLLPDYLSNGTVLTETVSQDLAQKGLLGTEANPIVPIFFNTATGTLLLRAPAAINDENKLFYTDKVSFDRLFAARFVDGGETTNYSLNSDLSNSLKIPNVVAFEVYSKVAAQSANLSQQGWSNWFSGSFWYPGPITPFVFLSPIRRAGWGSSYGAVRINPYSKDFDNVGTTNNPCRSIPVQYSTSSSWGWYGLSNWKKTSLEFNVGQQKPDFCKSRIGNKIDFPPNTNAFRYRFNEHFISDHPMTINLTVQFWTN